MQDVRKQQIKHEIAVINHKLSCPYLIGLSQLKLLAEKRQLEQHLLEIIKQKK